MFDLERICTQMELGNLSWVRSEICRYGVIESSTSWDNDIGSHRVLVVRYLDKKFDVKMHNGEVLSIIMMR